MHPTDQQLIGECLKGKETAYKALYMRYLQYAYSVVLRYAKNEVDAEELLNDAFVKAFKKLSQFDQKSEFRFWLRKIIVNTSVDYYRKSIKKSAITPLYDASEVMIDTAELDHLEVEDLMKMIQSLPEQYRLVFNLYEMEGYNHNEIGELLQIESSSSRSLLCRAKKILKDKILEEKKRLKHVAGY